MVELWEQVGNTPLVKLEDRNVFFKLEYLNPGGSHKDRMAVSMLLDIADRYGKEGAIVESTSGSTGVALSLYGRLMGFDVYIVAKETASPVKISVMKKLGAHVILCPNVPPEDPRSIVSVAKRIVEEKGAYFTNQDANPANPRGQETMADEILEQMKRVDVFVMGVGTGGTITGVARKLKKEFDTYVIAVTAEGSKLAESFGKKGEFKGDIDGYDSFHIPKNLDLSLIDEVYVVSPEEAKSWASQLISRGIFGGHSSGAHYKAALDASKRFEGNILTIAADHALYHPYLFNSFDKVRI